MLDQCLIYLSDRMNQSIKSAFDVVEDIVLVASPSDNKGQDENKILIFISKIEKDIYSKPGYTAGCSTQQRAMITNKPLYLSISVVVASNFSGVNYTDGLKILSHLLAFFHRNPLFNRQNAPDLPELIEQITMEMESIPEGQLSPMWSMLGARYLPSCVYLIRASISNSEALLAQVGQLQMIQTTLSKKNQ